MNPIAIPRSIARAQYAALRLPWAVLEEHVVAGRRGEGGFVRLGVELYLGSLDLFAGWLLADEQISQRGQALMRGTLPTSGAPVTKVPVQAARDESVVLAWPADILKVGDQDQEHDGEAAAKASTTDVRFTLPAEVQAGTVALCGEFNNWSAQDIRLERGGDGTWQATVALEPGRSYRYRYLLDGERWENAWHADGYVPNSYGGTDSVVVVE